MGTLSELQARFAGCLAGTTPPAGTLDDLVVADAFGPDARAGIYRNNVLGSLATALADLYPVVARLVGEDFFGQTARAYVAAHPSTSGNLHDFGAEYPGFLAALEQAGGLPYLSDVARVELARHRVFHAADAPGADLAALAALAPEHQGALRFALHPAARLVASPFPVLRIWETNQPGFCGDDRVSLEEGPEQVLVIRRGVSVTVERLDAGEYALLAALDDGATLDEASRAACDAEPDHDLARSLERHLLGGTLIDRRRASSRDTRTGTD